MQTAACEQPFTKTILKANLTLFAAAGALTWLASGCHPPRRPPAPPPAAVTAQQPVQEPERSAAAEVHEEDIGKKLEQRIEESIMRMVDAGLEKLTLTPEPSPDTDVEELAERGASLDDSIRAKVDAALRAHGISSQES